MSDTGREMAKIVVGTVPGVCPDIALAYSRPTLQLSYEGTPQSEVWWWISTFLSDPREKHRTWLMHREVRHILKRIETHLGHALPEDKKDEWLRDHLQSAWPTLDSVLHKATKTPVMQAAAELQTRIPLEQWRTTDA